MDLVQSSRGLERAPGPGRAGLLVALRQVLAVAFLGVAPIVATAVVLGMAIGDDAAFDFRQFWQGGRDVAHGVSPYPAPGSLPEAEAAAELDPHGIQETFRFPYPAPAALALAPLGVLSFPLAATVFTLLLLAATPAALIVLGVRDWRCHGAACLSITTIGAVRLGTLTPLLLLGLAFAWRYRDRARVAVPVLAAVITFKLFLWPLLVWLVATGRVRSAIATFAVAVAGTVGAWAVLGFAGFREYPELVNRLADAVQAKSYSVASLGLTLGLPDRLASLTGAAGAVAIGLTFVFARRAASAADAWAITSALVAALLLTPILWLHYFVLLFLPLALFRARFSPVWLTPLAFWLTPFQESGGEAWRIAFVWLTLAIILGLSVGRAGANPRPRLTESRFRPADRIGGHP
jgi:hypothetical protein